MNQEPQSFAEQSRQAQESTRRLKKRMIMVLIGLAVFAVVAIPLINILEAEISGGNEEMTNARPLDSVIFATPDYEYDIMQDRDYLNKDRTFYYHDRRSGVMQVLEDENLEDFCAGTAVLKEMIDCLIAGDVEGYNALFSDHYFEHHKKENGFTMQQIYDINLTKVNESEKRDENGRSYTQYEFEVEFKIRWNNGTYRTDIGHDESRKQYYVLSDSTGKIVLIDQILNYNYS